MEARCEHCGALLAPIDRAARRCPCCDSSTGGLLAMPREESDRGTPGRDRAPSRERTSGGSEIIRHTGACRGDDDSVPCNRGTTRCIVEHVEQHIGPVSQVFREIVSDMVRLDVLWVPPTPELACHTLVTSGMSDRPMNTPEELSGCRYIELMVRLPADWPMCTEAFRDERHYWPIRWLKRLARLPHEFDTWLFMEHTVPNGDPPRPFAPGTDFCGWLIYPPLLVPEEFWSLRVDNERTIMFFAAMPLYLEEMKYKLSKGAEALTQRFEQNHVTEIIDVGRRNVCQPKHWPFP